MNHEELLSQLEKMLSTSGHFFGEPLTEEEWDSQGSPYVWSVVENKEDVILLKDSGYGMMALFVGGKLQGVSTSFVMSGDSKYVGLSETYLGNQCGLYKKL